MIDLRGERALVIGLGIEGVDLARYAIAEGARVTANDARPAEELGESIAQLEGLSVRYALGGHDPALAAEHDVLLVSQGVPLDLPLIAEARRLGKPVTSLTALFLQRCRGPVVGITGSSGKTTTTALVGAMFAAAGVPHVVGGNIGVPLLSRLADIDEETWVVLEVSHTQLELTDRSPHVATVTNVTPNHLDRYTWDEYVQLKRNHVAYQAPDDIAVLNQDNDVARAFAADTPATVRYTTTGASPAADGAFVRDGMLKLRDSGADTAVLPIEAIPLRGAHNVENVASAAATAYAAGIGVDAIASAVREFGGVPHRLDVVATVNGVTWVNDSIATTPERTLAGLRSFEEPIVLLLGGRHKNLPLEGLAAEAAARCRAVVCFGEARDLLAAAMSDEGIQPVVAEDLDDAVRAAEELVAAGDVVLLSPACTSFDAYPNFERRGEEFRALVAEIAQRSGKGVRP